MLKKLTMMILAVITAPACAQEPLDGIRPAALAFSETNPVTAENYALQAKSFVIVENDDLDKFPLSMHQELRTRAREFTSFTAGLFSSYSPEQTLSCLSWQSFDVVVSKHARLAATAEQTQYPMISALMNLKFSCITEQEAEQASQAFRKSGK